MAQKSFFWTTGGAGDGASTYTRADLSVAYAVLAAVPAFEGLAPSYLNALVASVPAANTARIGTGGAVVDGKIYNNDAAVDVNIPNAIGAGNTRIDRIVLRADWTAQTVRITRIAGVDAASPTAPAITQSSQATYDIKLYQVSVNTSGVVTILLDERQTAQIQAAGLAIDAVTAAALADTIIDSSHINTQVPTMVQRRGGSASDWATVGTTIQTVNKVRMVAGVQQASSRTYSAYGADLATLTISFPVTFTGTPIFFVWCHDAPFIEPKVASLGAASAILDTYNTKNAGQTLSPTFTWLAIGPIA